MSLYKAASGALVFGAGAVQWAWGLDSNTTAGNGAPNSAGAAGHRVNLLADMGVSPASLQSDWSSPRPGDRRDRPDIHDHFAGRWSDGLRHDHGDRDGGGYTAGR